jgi:V/A-type H+-transporting ATPase subunit A
MTKQYDMMKAIRSFSDLAYSAQVAGVTPAQINAIKSKNELPQIKFIREYKPSLAKIGRDMEAEFNALRSAA